MRPAARQAWLATKRAIDVVVSTTAVVLLSPMMAITALVIRLDSPGPVIFRQQRLGRGGRAFTMYKFRTMKVGAEAGGVYEHSHDDRVTRAGRVLRRTSLDELPQLANIIRGDMSIIGPRPTLTYHPWTLDQYTAEQRRRFEIRPGVTGWAQVNGRKSVDWHSRIRLDVDYLDRSGPALDAYILLLTIVRVVSMQDNVNTSQTVSTRPRTEIE